MNISITIGGANRTTDISWPSFSLQDNIDSNVNSLFFEIRKYGAIIPQAGQEVIVYDGATKIYAGNIVSVSRKIEDGMMEVFSVQVVDYSHVLSSRVIVERYEDQTVNEIIADLLNTYHVDFADDYVDCDIEIKSIAFNNISVLEAIQKLADATNYRWYVDYDKKIHFFAGGDEASPFDLTDSNGKYIFKSLETKDDISQLRNMVKIRGGEIEGESRTELFSGDGEKLIFPLANKFSSLPTVTVGGSSKTVGAEYLDAEDDFDCFWNYNEKYVRFKTATVPTSGSNNIVVTGTPLIPIIVRKFDSVSIAEYGLKEFYLRDNTIRSREEALQYATAQLEAYKNAIIEGSFVTYESGLKSGQQINIQSTKRNINEDFIIQSVFLSMNSPEDGEYKVSLATVKTISIIDFLQSLLKTDRRIILREQEQEPLLNFFQFDDAFEITDSIDAPIVTEPPYMWMPISSDDDAAVIAANPTKTPWRWNLSTWSA